MSGEEATPDVATAPLRRESEERSSLPPQPSGEEDKTKPEEGVNLQPPVSSSEPEATAATAMDESSPPISPTSSLPSPLLPLPDFMTALNMQLARDQPIDNGSSRAKVGKEDMTESPLVTKDDKTPMTLGPGPKEVLIEKFKQGMH